MAVVSQVEEDEPLPPKHPEPNDPLAALVNLLRNCLSLSLLVGFLMLLNLEG